MVNSRRLKSYAALLAAFVLGGAAGAGAAYAAAQHRYAMFFEGRRGLLEERRVSALARALDLDGQQEAGVRKIVERHAEARRELVRSMYEQCGEPVRRDRAQMEAEIRGLLHQGQIEEYDRLLTRTHARFPLGPARPTGSGHAP